MMSEPAKLTDDPAPSNTSIQSPTQPGPGGDAGNERADGGDTVMSDGGEKLNDEAENAVEEVAMSKASTSPPDNHSLEDTASNGQDEKKQENPTPDTSKKESPSFAGSIEALLQRDLHHLTRSDRSILYQEGLKQQVEGQLESALKCFLGAITGLSEGSSFEELPKCLHAVADIYFEKNEYEKAVYFIQAEKMYYETALIDIVSPRKDTDPTCKSEGMDKEDLEQSNEEPGDEANRDDPDDDLSPDAKKGQEFENLARLCLKEGKLQLSLDYCGKATKIYQSVYGDEHPITVAALDLFTVIYADVGKKLYTDAMNKFEKEEEALKSERSHDSVSPDTASPDHATELRQRFSKSANKEVNGVDERNEQEDRMHQGELEPTSSEDRDDWVMTVLLMLIFFLATVFIVIVISSVYCYNNARTGYCAETRGDINYWYMYVRHFIHDIRKKFR